MTTHRKKSDYEIRRNGFIDEAAAYADKKTRKEKESPEKKDKWNKIYFAKMDELMKGGK